MTKTVCVGLSCVLIVALCSPSRIRRGRVSSSESILSFELMSTFSNSDPKFFRFGVSSTRVLWESSSSNGNSNSNSNSNSNRAIASTVAAGWRPSGSAKLRLRSTPSQAPVGSSYLVCRSMGVV